MKAFLRRGRDLKKYPTIMISLVIICALLIISVATMIRLPLSEAIALWNGHSDVWIEKPLLAQPVWTNLFRREKLPETLIVNLGEFESTLEPQRESVWIETTVMTFGYDSAQCPSEAVLLYDVGYGTKRPLLTLTWIKPDGSETQLFHGASRGGDARIELEPGDAFGGSSSADSTSDIGSESPRAMPGEYKLRAEAMVFEEEGFSLDGRLIIYGSVYGIAGTDNQRRDLSISLLWGMPIALMFGLIAATGTTLFGFVVAAIGAWYGGWVDAVIQRITEISMMIPFLPTIMMVGWFFSKSIWVLLLFIIAFSLFSGPLKSYRAMFLQMKKSQYIEAARAYGAGNMRIVFRYLIPRMIPTVLPRLILGVPLFVFLETSLAFLGIADPHLPTWGKVLSEAREALYMGHYHWVLGPVVMLFLTGLSFSMLGYALDRVFNPRLRDV